MPRNPRAVSVKKIQNLDEFAIKKLGIPSVILMENAGRTVAEVIFKQIKKYDKPRVSVVCGTGHNGGDGFVVSRYLNNAGVRVATYLTGKEFSLKQDALVHYQILKNLGCPVREIHEANLAFKRDVLNSQIIVDAIFGVGLNRPIEGSMRNIIDFINLNKKGKKVFSVDTPSGLDATTGAVCGVCIKADVTVTFSLPKSGFYKRDGGRYAGRVIVADIGIPQALIKHIL